MTDIQTTAAALPAAKSTRQDVGFTTADGLDFTLRVAKLLAGSNLVPREYQGNVPNAAIALNMAARIGADPLQVMQSLVVIHGRPSWSAQFLIACFNQCGRYSSIRYRMTGEKGKDSFGCIAYAKELATGDTIESSEITLTMAKAEGWYNRQGSKWQTIPDHMLKLRAAAWLVRTHAPELAMGLQTQEEVTDAQAIDLRPARDGTFEAQPIYDEKPVSQHEVIMSMVDAVAEPKQQSTVSIDVVLADIESAPDMATLHRIAGDSKWLPIDDLETARSAWKVKAAQLRGTTTEARDHDQA